VALDIQPPVGFGDEDAGLDTTRDDTSTGIDAGMVLVDLGATPEAEQQGRLLTALTTALPAGVPVLVLADEAAFRARFAAVPERLAQRRAAWLAFADQLGIPLVIVDLDDPDLAGAEVALQAALDQPGRRVAA
jgi:hypothetical protein